MRYAEHAPPDALATRGEEWRFSRVK